LVFIDSGVVGRGKVRAAIGTGVRFTIHLGRPIPLEINIAVPMLSDSEDEEQVFSFQMGGLF
jgi:outer membrane protein assembly factor BamA